MDRYFIGKFKKGDPNVANLVEVNNAFVLFELLEGEEDLNAIFSNTTIKKGEAWTYREEKQPKASKFKALSKKSVKI